MMKGRKAQAKIKSAEKNNARKAKNDDKINQQMIKEKIEKDKRLIMWSGVTFFMSLILVFWIFNIKSIFKTNEAEKQDLGFELTNMTGELGRSIGEFRKSWEEAKTEKVFDLEKDANTATSSELTKEEIEELKIKIEELEEKLNNQENN